MSSFAFPKKYVDLDSVNSNFFWGFRGNKPKGCENPKNNALKSPNNDLDQNQKNPEEEIYKRILDPTI